MYHMVAAYKGTVWLRHVGLSLISAKGMNKPFRFRSRTRPWANGVEKFTTQSRFRFSHSPCLYGILTASGESSSSRLIVPSFAIDTQSTTEIKAVNTFDSIFT